MNARALAAAPLLGTLLLASCASMPVADGPTLRTITVSLEAPDAGWRLEVTEAHVVDGAVWVLAAVDRREGPAAQVITEISDTIHVTAPAKAPVEVFIVGPPRSWIDPAFTVIADRALIADRLDDRIHP